MKQIPSYPNYSITEDGFIFSNKTLKKLKPRININGYMSIILYKDGKKHTVLIHRAIAETYIPNPHKLATVNHKDGNKLNNELSNLEWMSQKDNNIHAIVTGLNVPRLGESRAFTKLTEKEVIELRLLREQGLTMQALADKFNICISNVYRIVNRENWRHV